MTDEAVISGIRSRDEKVISEIMVKYSRLLWRLVTAVLHNVGTEQDAEECVADVFIHLWQEPDKFEPDRGSLKSWLCIVARSRAIDRYRTLTRCSTVTLQDAMLAGRMGLQDALQQAETRRELAEAVDALDALERDILLRRYFYEQKPKQIALALGLTVKQVDNYLYRSKKKLRQMISIY